MDFPDICYKDQTIRHGMFGGQHCSEVIGCSTWIPRPSSKPFEVVKLILNLQGIHGYTVFVSGFWVFWGDRHVPGSVLDFDYWTRLSRWEIATSIRSRPKAPWLATSFFQKFSTLPRDQILGGAPWWVSTGRKWVDFWMHIYTYIYLFILLYIYIFIYIFINIYIYIYINIYIFINIYI